jgi:hypothetical protein
MKKPKLVRAILVTNHALVAGACVYAWWHTIPEHHFQALVLLGLSTVITELN